MSDEQRIVLEGHAAQRFREAMAGYRKWQTLYPEWRGSSRVDAMPGLRRLYEAVDGDTMYLDDLLLEEHVE